jgi:hypothetical protein
MIAISDLARFSTLRRVVSMGRRNTQLKPILR